MLKIKGWLRAAALCVAFCLLLTGCSIPMPEETVQVEELLRAPRLAGDYGALQTALNDWLGESAQLKYPIQGELLSPFVLQDLDGDGIVEIPTQPDEAGLLNMSQSRRMDFIVWMDYTSPEPKKSFGLLDEETNCYIELPMEWEGNLKLTDSEQYDGAVELRTVDEDELVMTLRLVRTTSSLKGWTRLGIVASRQMQAKLAPDVEISDKNYRLSKALHLLN